MANPVSWRCGTRRSGRRTSSGACVLEDVVAYCAMPVVAGRGKTPRDIAVRLLEGRAAAGDIEGPDYVIRPAGAPEAANDAV